MHLLKRFINWFTRITTGTLIISTIAMKISGLEVCTVDILWQILLVGIVTTILTMAVLPDKEYSLREGIIRYSVHFVLLSATVLTLGALFGWYTPTFLGCTVMVLYVALVYAFTYFAHYLNCKRSADEINKALERRRNGK